MYKILTTSLALAAFASLALGQGNVTVTVTETVVVSNTNTFYTTTSYATYTSMVFFFVDGCDFLIFFYRSLAASASQTAPPANHTIKVGDNNTLLFDPVSLNANVGDTVIFVFLKKNHTATRSTLADPCKPAPAPSAFDSGL